TLTDPGSGNMPSHTVLAPTGWTVTGGAWWPGPNFFNILPSQDVTITAPDGRMVRLGPSIGATDFRPNPALGIPRPAEGTADNGYPVIYMPGSLEEWRHWIQTRGIPSSYPKAANIRVEPVTVLPEFTTILQRQLAPFRQQQAISNQQSQAM